ncbi:MAG: NAD(P)-dependent oxidoreductase [Thermodesulfobacteriota bacterium]
MHHNVTAAAILKAEGLRMRVIAYEPYIFGPVMEARGVQAADLDTLLKESDFISLQ